MDMATSQKEAYVGDDRRSSLRTICARAGESLVEQLLNWQLDITNDERSLEWARKLTCLSVHRDRSHQLPGILHRIAVKPFEYHVPYVAVSYCCTPQEKEN